jgi:hypothetical protein
MNTKLVATKFTKYVFLKYVGAIILKRKNIINDPMRNIKGSNENNNELNTYLLIDIYISI